MSYRDRRANQPSTHAVEDYQLRKAYQAVFSTTEGRTVLDHIVQNICGVDAVVSYSTDVQAFMALERKNVGLMIARMALEPIHKEQTVEVKT